MGTTAGPTPIGKMLNLAAVTTSNVSQIFDNHNHRGAQIGVNITAASGTMPVLTVFIEGQDEASGVWYPILTSIALSATGFNRLTIYPGVTPVLNQAVSDVLPATWRIRYTISGGTPSFTATFGVCLLK